MRKYYVSTYYINTYLSEDKSAPPTIIHLVLYIGASEKETWFHVLQENIKEYLKKFDNVYLSRCQGFPQGEVTLVSMGEFFYCELERLLRQQGEELYQLEVYSTPTRRYKISDRLLLPVQYPGDVVRRIGRILEWEQRLHLEDKEDV